MTIDALSYVKRLESAGVPRQQAEAHAEAMRDEIAPQVATKIDLETSISLLRKDLDVAVTRLDGRIGTESVRLEQRMDAIMWNHTVSIILAMIAIAGFLSRFGR